MTSIERHLLNHGGWVSVAELCRLFQIRARDLRTRDETPGICSDFAISGNAGLKHIDNATEGEWKHFESRLRSHGIGELQRVKRLRVRRRRKPIQPELALT